MENAKKIQDLKDALGRLKQKQARLLKDKAASPLQIMEKNLAVQAEMEPIKAELAKLEEFNV